MPCGGEIDVFVERSRTSCRTRRTAVQVTVLEGERAGERRLLDRASRARPEPRARARRRAVFAEVLGPPPRIVAIGAIDTAEELCRAARRWAGAPSSPTRGPRSPPANGCRARTSSWSPGPTRGLSRSAARDTAVVVLTHEERLDVPALTAALESEAFYVGAIGSRRTQAKRRERLLEAGVGEEQLERLSGPAGPRSRRAHSGGDGGFDPGRGRGGPRRPLRRPAREGSGPHSQHGLSARRPARVRLGGAVRCHGGRGSLRPAAHATTPCSARSRRRRSRSR